MLNRTFRKKVSAPQPFIQKEDHDKQQYSSIDKVYWRTSFPAGFHPDFGNFYLLSGIFIFLVAVFLAFATGTSWGTFSILIPIVCHAFPQGEMLVVSIAACLSGAVCGDHCSPISDTTIMASAGAHCSHVNHVSTQLPYAITAASCSAACYVITGLTQMFLGSSASLWTSLILLGVAIVLELVVLNILRVKLGKKTKA